MRGLATIALLLLLAPATARGEDLVEAADVTERGRPLAGILDLLLVPREAPGTEGRTLVFLVDVTASLQRSDFAGELEAALERNAPALGGTRIGIARAGPGGGLLLEPTARHEEVARTVREVCATADTAFQNVYADLRRLVPELRGAAGPREIVLVTLENGDAEDDVEATVSELERGDVRVSVVAREAFLSDTYWVLEPPRGPPGTRFTGSDNAFVDIPWGVRFQWAIANNGVLSGFAMYGLTRVAAATAGKVYLFYPHSGIPHVCCAHRFCTCPFCAGDHRPAGEAYQAHRLRAVSPLAVARPRALAHADADPFYRAVNRAWKEASRESVTYSRPSLERSGGLLRIEPHPYKGLTPLGTTVAFGSEVARGRRLVRACDLILRRLEADIEAAEAAGGSERYRAVADTTRLIFQVTRLNLLLYVAYCEEVGPAEATRRAVLYEPPEAAAHPEAARFLGIGYWQLSLCHGVAPYKAIRFPGGQGIARELGALRASWDAFTSRWAHTPYVAVARRLGLARFFLVRRPGYIPPGKRRVPDSATEEAVTLPERPARPSRPGSGTSGSETPTTGG